MEVFFVDQSGKVEQTNMNTVVAATNTRSVVVILQSRDKQRIFRYAKMYGRRHLYLRVFAYAIFRAVEERLGRDLKIVIDEEYAGKEHIIRRLLCNFIIEKRGFFDIRRIVFDRVGKHSKAHGLSVLMLKADKVIVFSEKDWKKAVG